LVAGWQRINSDEVSSAAFEEVDSKSQAGLLSRMRKRLSIERVRKGMKAKRPPRALSSAGSERPSKPLDSQSNEPKITVEESVNSNVDVDTLRQQSTLTVEDLAIEAFNLSEHSKTVVSVSRSLGSPTLTLRRRASDSSVLTLVAGWELSWYRYEIQAEGQMMEISISGRGSDLSDLSAEDLVGNVSLGASGELQRVVPDQVQSAVA